MEASTIKQQSPFHAECALCKQDIFIPRGEHIAIIENGKTRFYHQEPATIMGSRKCYSKYKRLS